MHRLVVLFAVVILFLGCTPTLLRAQDANEGPPGKTASETSANSGQHAKPLQPYRLDFSFLELEDGKKINTRRYTLDLTAGTQNQLKIGARVPVSSGTNSAIPSNNFQYMDVGTTIWANLAVEGEGELRLDVKSDVSNLDLNSGHDHNGASPPVVRQIQIGGTTLLVTGKPILIGSMDDPNSNRQFQLEVTATKLR